MGKILIIYMTSGREIILRGPKVVDEYKNIKTQINEIVSFSFGSEDGEMTIFSNEIESIQIREDENFGEGL